MKQAVKIGRHFENQKIELLFSYFGSSSEMAALAANAVKSQRRKAANKMAADQAMNNVNEQRIVVNTVAQKHRDSLSSMSTVDSLKPEVMQLMFSTRTKYCCVLQIRGDASMTK